MRSIAIILNDNDFGSTFSNLLKTIRNSIIYHNKPISEENVRKLIYVGIRFHYIAFQNTYNYIKQGKDFESHVDSIEKYLNKIRILFDDDADNECLSKQYDGGAWHLEIESGQITYF